MMLLNNAVAVAEVETFSWTKRDFVVAGTTHITREQQCYVEHASSS